jgi:hypothetical protein
MNRKCYIWSSGSNVAETWTFRETGEKYVGIFEVCTGERWKDHLDPLFEK